MNQEKNRVLSPKELASLTERVLKMLPELNKYEELPGVPYDHPQARDLYQAAANGFLPGVPCPRLPEKSFACSDLPKLFENAHSSLAKTAALNVYKKAREAVQDERYDNKLRDELFEALEKIKLANRNCGKPHDVVGNCNDPNRWIYSYENGPMVREVTIHSKKPGMNPLEIVQFSDAHFNYCNEKDFTEANPALLSTYEHRLWHANGDSADVVDRSFAYAAMSDQTILTGDLLDYLSYGSQELTQKHLFWRDPNLLAAIGGHEVTREMQGVVADPTTSESRFDILQSFWCNDIFYTSKVLGDRVLAVVMDNGSTGTYSENQFNRLQSDLAYAKEQNLIVLLFQHEPICTANPAETDVPFIRANDPNASRNFFKDHIGGEYTQKVLKDEWTMRTCRLIRQNSNVIKGVFCGHLHSDFYTEIYGIDASGMPNNTIIPQYILTATVYENLGHVMKITIN